MPTPTNRWLLPMHELVPECQQRIWPIAEDWAKLRQASLTPPDWQIPAPLESLRGYVRSHFERQVRLTRVTDQVEPAIYDRYRQWLAERHPDWDEERLAGH